MTRPAALPLAATEPTLDEVLLGRARCASCGATPAPFGFGHSVLRGLPGLWFCPAHRAHGERRPT